MDGDSDWSRAIYIKSIRLKNWCRFRDAFFEFGDMTSIRGPNGSGKTSLVSAIPFALTGVPGQGTLEENICQLAEPAETSSVELVFKHGTSHCSVKRELPRGRERSQVTLVENGETTRGAVKVKQRLGELLRVDERLLTEYVFVPQWGMFSFLEQKSEERAKAFAKLFGTERAEAIWRALGEAAMPVIISTIDAEKTGARLRELDGLLSQVGEELSIGEKQLTELNQSAAERNRLLEARRLYEFHSSSLATATHRKQAADTVVDALVPQVESASLDLTTLERQRDELQPLADAAGEIVAEWEKFHVAVARRRKAVQDRDLATAKEQEHGKTKPAPPAVYVVGETRKKMRDDGLKAESSLMTLRAFLGSCDPDRGVSACPTCGTPVKQGDLAARIAEAKQAIPVLADLAMRSRDAVSASELYDSRMLVWLSRLDDLVRQKTYADAEVAKLGDTPVEPARSCAEASRARQAVKDLAPRVSVVRSGLRRHEDDLSAARARAEVEGRNVAELTGKLAELPQVSEADKARLLAEVERQASLKSYVEVLRLRRDQTGQHRDDCLQLLQKAAEEKAANRRIKATADHVGRLRTLFHRDNLPAQVSRYFLTSLQKDVNILLERFEQPFRLVGVEDDLTLMIRFHDGRVGSAQRMLSGGEKMLLALDFRVTVGLLFASDLGVLCLDEPTVGLDADNLGCVELALNRLRELAGNMGLQFLLVTHEPGLDHVCDKVINLGGAV